MLGLLAYEDLKGLQYVDEVIIEDAAKTLVDSPSRISRLTQSTQIGSPLKTSDSKERISKCETKNAITPLRFGLYPCSFAP